MLPMAPPTRTDIRYTYCAFRAAMASFTECLLNCCMYLYIEGLVSLRFSSVLPFGTVANLNGRGLCDKGLVN